MKIIQTPFGGVLVKTDQGNYAVNAGGTMEEMESAYLPDHTPPQALILTTEHIHRFKNALNFSSKFGIPLIGSFIAFVDKRIQIPERWDIFLPRTIIIHGISICMFHVQYDSADPFALTISDENDSLGIITDGKLTPKWPDAINKLSACRQIYFGNILPQLPASTSLIHQRYTSTYNTPEEINSIFRAHKRIIMNPLLVNQVP